MPGGRPKGARNKKDVGRLIAVREKIKDFDPLIAMHELYMHPRTTLDQKITISNNMAPYFHAKLKSVEVTGEIDHTLEVSWLGESPDSLPAKAAPGDDT